MRSTRHLVLIVGILVVISGVVLASVPLFPDTTKTVTAAMPVNFHISSRVPVLPSEPVSVSWSSADAVTVVLRTCSSIDANASAIWGQCTGGSNVTRTGASGFVWTTVPLGAYLWVAVFLPGGATSNVSASVALTTTSPSGALGLWAFGGLVVILGALLVRRKKRARTAELPLVPSLVNPVAPTNARTGPGAGSLDEKPDGAPP